MTIFTALEAINDFIWGHINFAIIIGFGVLLSLASRFFQVRQFPKILKIFYGFFKEKESAGQGGVHPLKAFSAAIGGCIGIGNVVGICTAIQIGGPGALFWTWIAGLLGMLLKYSEVYLGMIHRVKNADGGYDGGPMYFLKKAFNNSWIPSLVCLLLCVYGVEVYMFSVMVDSVSTNWEINKYLLIALLLALTLFAVKGGVKRVGKICSTIMPIFLLLYIFMSFWVIFSNVTALPEIFMRVIKGAFTAQAATGAFAGSSIILTISLGMSRGCYSGDIGIGYASVIHAESSSTHPARQASLAIIGIFLDVFIVCTLSILLVLTTDTWKMPLDTSLMVQTALGHYFPCMHLFMPFFLFLLGYSTIIAYFTVGLKCAHHLFPKNGKKYYYLYAFFAFILFSFFDPTQALTAMSLAGALLLIINLMGIFRLRKEIRFDLT
jgi:alanine or glycine:cation symporter, AGCS family